MSEALLSLITGANGIFVALGAAIVAALGMYFKGRSAGKAAEKAKQAKQRMAAAEERLEMHREADAIERAQAAKSHQQAQEEVMKWAKRH